MSSFKKYLPLAVIATLSILAWVFNLHHLISLEALKTHEKFLNDFVHHHFLLAIFIYGMAYIAVVSLSIPIATVMTLIGGFLLGQVWGAFCVVIAATLGSSILFLSARLASSGSAFQKENNRIERMRKGFQSNAFSYLLTLRFIPIFPFAAINLAAAFFQIPLKTFFLATFIGIIPGSFVYVSLGVALRQVIQTPDFSPHLVLDPKILIAFIGLGFLSLAPVIYHVIVRRKNAP